MITTHRQNIWRYKRHDALSSLQLRNYIRVLLATFLSASVYFTVKSKISAESLARYGAPAVDMSIEALSHPEMGIRIHAIEALSKIKDERVTLVLLEMLDDPEREVKKHVIEALGYRKDSRALPALQEIAANRADRGLHILAKSLP